MIDPAPRTPAFMLDEHRARYVFWILTERDRGDHACLRCYPHGEMARADFLCLRHELEDYFITLRASVRPITYEEALHGGIILALSRPPVDPELKATFDKAFDAVKASLQPSPALSVRQQVIEAAWGPPKGPYGYEAIERTAAINAAREALTIARDQFQYVESERRSMIPLAVIQELLSSLSGAPDAMDLNQRPIHGMAESACDNRAAEVDAHIDHVTAGAPDGQETAKAVEAVRGPEQVSTVPEAIPPSDCQSDGGFLPSSLLGATGFDAQGSPALTPFDPEQAQTIANAVYQEWSGHESDPDGIELTCATLLESALAEITRLEQDLTALHAEIRAQDAEVTRLQQENKALREPVEPQLRATTADPRGRQGSGL